MNAKKIKDLRKLKIYSILITVMILLVIILTCMVFSNNRDKAKETEPLAVDEIITANSEIESAVVENQSIEEVKVETVDGYKIIETEIELLKGKDIATIEKYFGKSDVFTGDAVSDKVKSTVITFIPQPSSEEVIVHICSLDYDKLKEASVEVKSTIENNETDNNTDNINDTVKKEVAKGVIKGQYDIHYNIPVSIKNNEVVVTENFKQAITGNWYHGVNTYIESIDCPIKTMEENK